VAERCALIVANDVYEHEGLRRLASPVHDAEALQAVLADPHIGRFQVKVIRNQPSHIIQREIANFFADRKPDDFLLLHFSCHGLKSASGALYLAGSDTVPTRLTATAVPAQFVNQEMADSRARRIALLLDCCYGGAFSRGMRARAADAVDLGSSFPLPATGVPGTGDGRGRVVITASSATEYAFEDGTLRQVGRRTPSVFTSALVEGLSTGEADTSRDGVVDVDELYEYVYAQVRAGTTHQTPQKWVDLQGKLVIGWAPPAARLVAAELPDELVSRVRDQRAGGRLAGVDDLRRVLLDQDRERAAGAMDLLLGLTEDDSKEVSTAASAALEEAQLKPVPPRIDIAQGRPGDPSASHTVRLVGSPLAQVFQATTASRWISVRHSEPGDGRGAWVTALIDPAAVAEHSERFGPLHGSISVRNRLGEFEIPVTAQTSAGLFPKMAGRLPGAAWARDRKVLGLLGAAILGAWPMAEASTLHGSSLVGAGYFLLRAGLLFLGIVLMDRPDTLRPVGLGFAAASLVYFLTDAMELLHTRPGAVAWLEFFTVGALTAAMVIRLWPFSAVPRRLAVVAPSSRPLAWVPLGAAAVQLFMLFVSVPGGTGTLADQAGLPGIVLAVGPMTGLCVVASLTEITLPDQRLFVAAAVAAYFGPELYFLLASLLLAPRYAYLGDDLAGNGLSAGWFVLAQSAVTAVLALSTAMPLWRSAPPPGGSRRPVRDR
jgi:hypothetical protein